jgi:hypothetical protein
MSSTEQLQDREGAGEAERPGRPWVAGVGFLLLGLGISAGANALALQGETSPVLRALGAGGYALGLLVSGSGVHRVLWAHPTARPPWMKVLLTAAVTLPSFVAIAIVLSILLTITQMRFGW